MNFDNFGAMTAAEPAFQAPDIRNRVCVATSSLTGSSAQATSITLPGGYKILRAIGFPSVKARIKVDDGSFTYFEGRADDVQFSRLGVLLQRPIPDARALNVTMTPLEGQTITDCQVSFMLE